MAGMETLHFDLPGGRALAPFAPVLVGVVASGNLEVLLEPSALAGCRVDIDTSAQGFGAVWERSEERRVGKECFQGCRSRWSPYH